MNTTLNSGPESATVATRRPEIGDIVAEKFKLERLIGRGGMGFVMAARHIELDELFAIKFIEQDDANDVVAAGRFYREARATLRLKNEHVVRVFDASAGQDGSMSYIIMEYLEGSDLASLLKRSGPLSVEQAIDYVLQASEAIAEAHALGIVHRDIKPANLVLTSGAGATPVIKVLDFGIATGPSDRTTTDFTLTETGAVFGSPAYMSPEQLRSTKHVDHRADVWSLGVVLYELVCGKAPFDAASGVELSMAILMDQPPSLRKLRPDAPIELERIVLACLEKDREARVPSVVDLARLLRPLAGPLGLTSCDTIARIGSTGSPPSLPAPAVPSARPSTTPVLSFGKTEPEMQPLQISRNSSRGTIALIAAFTAVAVLSALLTSRLGAHRAENAASLAPPSPVALPVAATEAPQVVVQPTSLAIAVLPTPAPATPAPTTPAPAKAAVSPPATLAARARSPSVVSTAASTAPAAPPAAGKASAPTTPAAAASAVSPNRSVSNESDPDLALRY